MYNEKNEQIQLLYSAVRSNRVSALCYSNKIHNQKQLGYVCTAPLLTYLGGKVVTLG